jgi:hypothetical protein
VGNDRPRDVAARIEREGSERAQFSPREGLVALSAELCLDGPVLPVPVKGYQVDALVGVWKFESFTDLGGHVAQQPDVSQDGSVFWRGLEVELNKPLKCATHLRF